MQLEIEYRDPSGLRPSPGNARTHSRKQIDQLARSIRSFGFNNPVLVDRDGAIVAGHGRVAAACEIGLPQVPTVCLEHLSASQKRAFMIADNKLAESAGWNMELLQGELAGLLSSEINFDLTDIGFETAELDLLLASPGSAVDEQAGSA